MEQSVDGSWNLLRTALKHRLSEQAYATWVRQMSCLKDDSENLILGLPDMFSLDWVNNHYRDVLEEELRKLDNQVSLALELDAAPAIPVAANSQPPTMSGMSAGPRAAPSERPAPAPVAQPVTRAPATPMNARYTFQHFVKGPSNELATAAAQSVADNPGSAYNPLFVFGRVGLGKTHLAQAIGHCIQRRDHSATIVYQTTEQFVNDVIQGIRFERMDEIRTMYRAADVLIIDDIQFIAGKEACQAEFFHTFNALYDAKKQVVVTSDKLPHEIKDLEERVRSRFQWGLIVDLQPPELETRVAIVKKKAENDGIQLPNDVAMFIAKSVRSNVRELEGCLIRVSAYASLTNKPITIELARSVLKSVIPGKSKLTCDAILKKVSIHFDLKVSELKSTKRGRAIALPRQISMYLCRKHINASYPEIGNSHGGKDHTTALNAFNRITERMDEPEVRQHVDELEREILE